MLIENVDIVRRERPRFVETVERLRRALERMQRLTEIAPGSGCARIGFDGGAEQALRLADLALLQLDRAEKIERVEIVRHGLEYAAVDFFRVAQLALALQRHRFVERLTDVKGPRIHSRLIRAMRRVTSAGVALSDFGLELQRRARRRPVEAARKPAFQMRPRRELHVDRAADDGGDVEIGHREILAEQIRLRGHGRVQHLEWSRQDLERLLAQRRIALGRRQPHRMQ